MKIETNIEAGTPAPDGLRIAVATLLGLDPEKASEQEILDAVKVLADDAANARTAAGREAVIQKRMKESGYALSREQAIQSIRNQEEHDAARAANTPKRAEKSVKDSLLTMVQ